MDIRPGWFTESWPEIGTSVEVEEVLYSEKSNYQDILVFKRLVYYISLPSCTTITKAYLVEGCVFSYQDS